MDVALASITIGWFKKENQMEKVVFGSHVANCAKRKPHVVASWFSFKINK